MLQIISRNSFTNVPPECRILSTLKIGSYTLSQLALSLRSAPSLKRLLLSHVQELSFDRLDDFDKQLEDILYDLNETACTTIFIHNRSLAMFRKSSNFTPYPLFYIELCHRTQETILSEIENEYALRLGALEPLLFLPNSDPCLHSVCADADRRHIIGYSTLTTHAALMPFYFSSSISLELYSTKHDSKINRPIIVHKIPIAVFLSQAEKTYTIPVNSLAEFRITYCGHYTLNHIRSLNRIPFMLPSTSSIDGLPILGHRGCGSNKIHCKRKVPIMENTPFSILTSHRMGCIGSELDVILTKDNIPVINHDFELEVIVDTNKQFKVTLPIPCMFYNEIIDLKNPRGIKTNHNRCSLSQSSNKIQYNRSTSAPAIYDRYMYNATTATTCKKGGQAHRQMQIDDILKQDLNCLEEEKASYSVITENKRVYTLTEVLTKCTDMILNIEIKYPSKFSPYSAIYSSRLALVQTVLDTLAQRDHVSNSSTSSILISSFDPIVCTIVKLLAPSIPVFLLFMGDNNTITPYMDVDLTVPSQLFSKDAISFAKSINLTGVVLWRNILDIQTRSIHLYEYAHQCGLTIFTYGTAIGENIYDQEEKGVSVLICDLCHHQSSERLFA